MRAHVICSADRIIYLDFEAFVVIFISVISCVQYSEIRGKTSLNFAYNFAYYQHKLLLARNFAAEQTRTRLSQNVQPNIAEEFDMKSKLVTTQVTLVLQFRVWN